MGYENIKIILRNLQDDAPESNLKPLMQVLNRTVLTVYYYSRSNCGSAASSTIHKKYLHVFFIPVHSFWSLDELYDSVE
jgi:hypothetical protein